MHCFLCQLLEWLVERDDPGWVKNARQRIRAESYREVNSDRLFEDDADPMRLRKAYELWDTDPARAFAEFISLGESGSVWSMEQVATALESGLGTSVDQARAEEWYRRAFERGSDLGLLRASYLAFTRGATEEARNILNVGVDRRLTAAMRYLAEIELQFATREDERQRARKLFEQAIELGDVMARVKFARARAYGYFGLMAIPAGIRELRPALHALVPP
jgi:TPR repeat protein